MNLADGKTESLTRSIHWDVDDFDISRDGRRLAFLVNESGHAVLHLYDPKAAREIAVPAFPAGEISALRFSPDGGELGFSLSAMAAPGDVYSVRLPAGPVTRWTESETGGVSLAGQREPERVKFKSFDGLEISALVYAADAKFSGRRPVVISIHGGPEGQSRPHSLGRWTYLTRELGVTLIEPNVRGSTGYGKTFLASDNGLKREDAVADLGALLDWIVTRPDLDPTRVMVMGGSYGGYMTLAALTHYSVRLRGGMDSVGISHFGTFLKNTSDYRRDLRRAEYGDERDPKMAEFFDRISPLNNTERITTPLFVMQGKNDPRVPWTEAEQMVKKVRAAGRPVWYLLADNEGHGFARKANVDFQFLAQMAFIEQFLLPVSLPSVNP